MVLKLLMLSPAQFYLEQEHAVAEEYLRGVYGEGNGPDIGNDGETTVAGEAQLFCTFRGVGIVLLRFAEMTDFNTCLCSDVEVYFSRETRR